MAVALFPLKIIATIVIFLIKATIKMANFIILLILTPLGYFGAVLSVIWGIMTAIAVFGMIVFYLNGDISLNVAIIALLSAGFFEFILIAPELIAEFLSDKVEDLCDFLDDINESMWL